MKKLIVIGMAMILLLVAGLAIFVSSTSSSELLCDGRPESNKATRADEPRRTIDSIPSSSRAVRTPTTLSNSETSTWRIRVITETSSPIADATIYLTDLKSRFSVRRSGDAAVLGKTDGGGLLRLNILKELPSDTTISAIAPGFCPSHLKTRPQADIESTVVLRAARSATVYCRDPDGQPIPGAQCTLSSIAVPELSITRDSEFVLPGIDERTAVYSELTDGKGFAVFKSLGGGKYGIRAIKEGYAKVAGPDIFISEKEEGLEDIVLAPLIGAIITVKGNYVTYAAEGSGDILQPDEATKRKKFELEAQHPFAIVFIGKAGKEEHSLKIKILAADLTVIQQNIELYPVDDPRAFQEITVPERKPTQCASVRIRIVDSKGRDYDGDDCLICYNTGPSAFFCGPVGNGRTSTLPFGHHQVSFTNPLLGRILETGFIDISESTPTDVVIKLRKVIRRCRFQFEGDAGPIDCGATIYLNREGRKTLLGLDNSRTYNTWFPVGTYRLSMTSFGIGSEDNEVEILENERPSDVQVVSIPVTITAKKP